jgi:hypothetical protein
LATPQTATRPRTLSLCGLTDAATALLRPTSHAPSRFPKRVVSCAGDVTVLSGTLEVDVQFMGTPIFQTEWDLCGKTQCPIKPGDIHIHYGQTLPPITPPVRVCRMRSLRCILRSAMIVCHGVEHFFAAVSHVHQYHASKHASVHM